MVEAINKNLKYNYLYRQPIEDGQKLRPIIEKAIHDYNELGPHGQLKSLTPAEAYAGMEVKDLKTSEKLEQARKKRIEINRNWKSSLRDSRIPLKSIHEMSNCKGCKYKCRYSIPKFTYTLILIRSFCHFENIPFSIP